MITVGSTFSASINFQMSGVTAPAGYFTDTGDLYASRGNGLTYGWNLTHTAYTRASQSVADRRLATLCRFRSGGIWEIAVPNGTYNVAVAIGDGDQPSTHTIDVEGTAFWTAQSLAAGQFVNRTLAVSVSDGRLTITQGGGAHEATRIDYVLIAASAAPPTAPSSLTATALSSSSVELKWPDDSSTETGFQLRRSIHADFSASTLLATLSADTPNFLDATVSAGTTYFYRVRATSAAGNSAFSSTVNATPRMPDLDGDGIPDPLESPPSVVGVDDRQIDSDGDGFSNASEYIAETDPLDSRSRPQITQMTAASISSSTTAVTLEFSTVPGLQYFVDFTVDLSGGIWTLVPGSERIGDGTQQAVTDETDSQSRFYRLRIWR